MCLAYTAAKLDRSLPANGPCPVPMGRAIPTSWVPTPTALTGVPQQEHAGPSPLTLTFIVRTDRGLAPFLRPYRKCLDPLVGCFFERSPKSPCIIWYHVFKCMEQFELIKENKIRQHIDLHNLDQASHDPLRQGCKRDPLPLHSLTA